ncbi:hypothetical protein HK097_003287 [Rhizophlyctis rosea]|uniref:Pyrroloquinoline quinone-dependent pyranose dehydrogenase beta-propeller domain-containing protein n=1 Tax=Rhizophlyctis rosea TaxID=64517 RepID=A0AAD5SGI6_9FUNG|nr:hypothetical protein HK097_003287 [Rhizophlyctis rosea]
MVQLKSLALLAAVITAVTAQNCQRPNPQYPLLTHPDWTGAVLVNNVKTPRGLAVDSRNNLLVVESKVGVKAFTINANGCITKTKTVLTEPTLNHAVTVSVDGKYLFVSSNKRAWRYDYDATTQTASNRRVIITFESDIGHITRTMLNPARYPHLLIVGVGSDGDLDYPSYYPTSGRSDVRIFDLRRIPSGGYQYLQGRLFGYGLRNEVGIDSDAKGQIWSVENSSDEIYRKDGDEIFDVSETNPAEKLHKLGNPTSPKAGWYGYPYCFTVYDPTPFPHDRRYRPGDQFVQEPGSTVAGVRTTDRLCRNVTQPAVIFPAHNAPLDLKFSPVDTNAYVALHGSNPLHREPGSGYKVVYVPGHYRRNSDSWIPDISLPSTKQYTDLLFNSAETNCHGFVKPGCFRPVALAWDRLHPKRLYVTSDYTGEIFVVTYRKSVGTCAGRKAVCGRGRTCCPGLECVQEGYGSSKCL